jgi:acetyl esterase/lipase
MAAADPALVEKRASIDAALGGVPLAEGTTAADRTLGGVPVIEVTADAAGPVLLYLHGGGFRMGSAVSYRAYGSHLAKAIGGRAVVVDYRLAPEDPFPAAPDDVAAVYAALLDEGVAAGSIVVAGDSAGGNLSAGLVLSARQRGLPDPAGVVCCSPWADLTNTAATYATRAEVDQLFSLASATEAAAAYLAGGTDPKEPLASPVFGDWRGAPPTLVQVGDLEVLLDDAATLASALRGAGVDVRHRVYADMPHVWQLGYPALPQAVEAVDEIAAFVREVTA